MAGLLARRRMERRLEEEIQSHLEFLEEEARRRGLSPAEARLAARREFGGVDSMREECRDTAGFPAVEAFLQDLRHAFRGMRRNPGFTLLVAAVLAVGIGACTTVFSILNTLFYRPLAYEHAEQLVMVGDAYSRGQKSGPMAPVDWYDYQEWQKQGQSFQAIVAYRPEPFDVSTGGDPERMRGERVAAGYFEMLGVRPLLGRGFEKADFQPGAAPVLVLSEEYWRRTLNGRHDVVGQTMRANGKVATVAGVMPGGLRATLIEGGPRIWSPLIPSPEELKRGTASFSVLARLKPEATLAGARAEMAVIGQRLAAGHPDPDHDPAVRVDGLQDTLSQAGSAPVAKVLIMAVALLLLLSCVNVANLLLGRATGRVKEAALRTAMGAGRWRLVRQFLAESLAFALAGGLAGVGLAYVATSWSSAKMGPLIASEGVGRFEMDGRVLAFALLTSVATALLFGILPAFRGCRVNVSGVLKDSGSNHSAGAPRQRLNEVLVVAEVTLSVVLVASAGLLMYSIAKFYRVNWGIPLDGRVAVQIVPNERTYSAEAKRELLYRQVLERAREIAGVQSAALVNSMPVHMGAGSARVSVEGSQPVQAGYRVISSAYHATAGLGLLAGRGFTDADTAGRPQVALVSESLAGQLWPGKSPIGERIQVNGAWRSIVGITADVRQDVMAIPKHEISVPYGQATPRSIRVLMQVAGDPARAVAELRRAVQGLDPDLPVGEAQSLRAAKEQLGTPYEFVMTLLTAFAVGALLLAGAGLYGVASRAVSARTREIGIRLALGADPRRVFRQVLRHGLKLALAGTVLGSLLAFVIIKALLTKVWWVSSSSAFAWIAPVAILMAVLAAAASLAPARRAIGIAPSLTLRAE
jgi:putative ABC transport system permease protein